MNAENDYIRAGQEGSLDDSPNAGKVKQSKSIDDLNSKEIEILAEIVTLSVKIGYTYIQEGLCDFQQWSKAMKDEFVANTSLITVLNFTDAEIDKFIKDTWNSSFTIGGEKKILKEWAFVQKTGRKNDTQCIKENDISSTQEITGISIPRNENGEYLFTQVPAEQTYAYLNAREDLTPKEVEMLVSLNIQEAQKRIKKLESKRPKTTSDLNEYLANKAKWEVERQQAQADFDYWNKVKAIRKGKKARCHSKISFNRTIVWLLSFLLLFFIALILFLLLNQKSDQNRYFLNKEISCADSIVNNFIAYQVITEDGMRQGVKKSDVEKYGWSEYAKAYPGFKVRMRDNDNRDYAVPIDKVEYALSENLRLFTVQMNVVKSQYKCAVDEVVKYQITTEDGKVHNVSKVNIEKYGWRGYAEDYPKATVRMRDVNNEDYDIPIDKVEYALSKNFRLYSIQLNNIEDNKQIERHSNGDVTMNGKKGYVTYSFTLPDGTKKRVQETGVKKLGWDRFANVLRGSTVDMKDDKGNRYQVPADKIKVALAGGLSPFTIFVSDEQWETRESRKGGVDVSKWLARKAPEQLLYQVIDSDGQRRAVRKSDIEKYGWNRYASDYPGYSLRMRDKDNRDYAIPFGMVDKALVDGLRPYVYSSVIDKTREQVERAQIQKYDISQWLIQKIDPEEKEALVQTSQDCLFTFAGSKKYMPYVVIITIGCILAGIWIIALKTKKKVNNKVDVKTNTFSIKTPPTKKQMSQRSLYMKKGFYYLILILLWMLCVLLMGLLFILFSVAPVVSWSYSIGIACAQPFVWLISLGIVLLLRPFVYKFMFKEKKVFSRTIAVVLLVFGTLFMIFKIGNAIYSRYVMDQLIENYDWESKYGQSKDEIF